MKKLMITLLALVMLFSLTVPAMAASPVKDYASAKDGDLLYTVNFNGDEAYTPAIVTGYKYFDITPSTDGTSIEFKGNGFYEVNDEANGKYVIGDGKMQGSIWGGKITSLPADATTQYTISYQIWIDSDDGAPNEHGGKNCYIGVGGMWESTGKKWYTFTSNYFTATAENREYSMRRNSGVQKDADGNEIKGILDSAMTPVKDNDGYVTVRLTFDGPTATYSAYILTNGTGDKASDWTKVATSPYTVAEGDCVAIATYAYSASTHAKIKNVNVYKGLVTGAADSSTPTPPPTGDVFTALPVALLVLSGAAVAVIIKKKEI